MTKKNLKTLIFLTFIQSSLISCTQALKITQEDCNHRDWYELGRQDGARGALPMAFSNHTQNCKMIKKEVVTLYKNGRNEGLVTYCQPQNAYELGRLNQSYNSVCPLSLKESFLNSYKKGQENYLKEQSSIKATNDDSVVK